MAVIGFSYARNYLLYTVTNDKGDFAGTLLTKEVTK
jgi:hypothetical protein